MPKSRGSLFRELVPLFVGLVTAVTRGLLPDIQPLVPQIGGGGCECSLSHPEEQITWFYSGIVPKPTAADWTVVPVPKLCTLKGVGVETGVGGLAEVTLLLPSTQQFPFPQL